MQLNRFPTDAALNNLMRIFTPLHGKDCGLDITEPKYRVCSSFLQELVPKDGSPAKFKGLN